MSQNGGATNVSEAVRQIALWLIPGAPLAACVLIALTGVRWLREHSHYPCILALVISLGSSLGVLLFGVPDAAGFGAGGDHPQIVAAGYDAAVVRRVVSLIDRAEYKRRQSPPGIRVTPRGFGRDRRYPITSKYQAPF